MIDGIFKGLWKYFDALIAWVDKYWDWWWIVPLALAGIVLYMIFG